MNIMIYLDFNEFLKYTKDNMSFFAIIKIDHFVGSSTEHILIYNYHLLNTYHESGMTVNILHI